MPFIRQQQLSIPPAIMVQRFCSMAAADLVLAGASHLHPAGALREGHRATRNHHHVHPGAVGAWARHRPRRPGHGHARHRHPRAFHQLRRCHSCLLDHAILSSPFTEPASDARILSIGHTKFQVQKCEFHRYVHGHPDQVRNHYPGGDVVICRQLLASITVKGGRCTSADSIHKPFSDQDLSR